MNSFPSNKAAWFLFFSLSAGCLFYLLVAGIDHAVDPVSLLPRNTAVLIDAKSPAEDINRFRKSKLGMQLASIQWDEVLREIGVREEDVQEFLNLTGELEAIVKSPIFNVLFANRVLLGLLPADSSGSGWSKDQTGIGQMMVLMARPRHRASLVDFFVGRFLYEFDHTVESYKGRQINTYTYDSRYPFSTTVTDGLFIASISPDLVKQCIDISINNMTAGYSGLQENSDYLQLKQRARGRDDQFIYVDIPNLQAIVENSVHAGGAPPHSGYHNGSLYGKEPLPRRLAIFRLPGKHMQSYSGIVQYRRNDERSGIEIIEQFKPERDAILALLPDDNVVHLWMNIFNAGRVWNYFRSEQNVYVQELVQHSEQLLANRTEYSPDEFLSLFGSQISMNIAEMRSSGIIPMPRISLYVEVLDREEVHGLLDKLFAGLPIRHSAIGGSEVYSIVLAGGLMQPSFMFYDKFLIMADSRKQLENMLSRKKRALLDNPFFKKVDVGLTEANNFVLYFRNAELIDGLKELVRWYGSLLQLFDSEAPAKNRVIIEKIVLPLLEGMKMYKVKTVRVYNGETEMVMQSSQLMENE